MVVAVVVLVVREEGICTKKTVIIKATKPIMAQINMTAASPKESAAGANRVAPVKAPNFPAAALKPFKVDRHSALYTKEGKMKVVVLGP